MPILEPTADLLAPILYDPAIAGTLLLVGSTEPLPSIEALLSPSHLLSNGPDQTIYPTLLPFVSPPGVDVAHSLESLLPHAINLAQQFRTRQNGSFRVWTDRHGSSDSVSSITPPGAPPAHLRKHSSLGLGEGIPRESWHSNWNGLSASPAFQPFSQKPDVRQSVSGPSLDRMRDISRPTPRSRLSSFTRNRITEADSKAAFSIRSPFDAVINFIPRASEFAPERALQDMLQQAVVVTTALLPLIARRTANTSREQGLPIRLLHVLPTHIPRPLPAVVESFLLCFLPTFAHRGEREIWGSVITTTAWLMDRVGQPSRKPDSVGEMSGAEVLLFGGVRCLLKVLNDQSNVQEVKARAFLASWGSCLHIPGFFAVARRSPVKPQVQSPHHQYSSPPSSLCSDVHLRTRPSTTYEERLPATPMIRRLSRLVFAQDPSMPELDASQSSASSSSGFGDSNGSEQIEGTQVPQVHVAQKENRGFSGWFKRKSKMMTA